MPNFIISGDIDIYIVMCYWRQVMILSVWHNQKFTEVWFTYGTCGETLLANKDVI